MSAVLPATLPPSTPGTGGGVWQAAWRRLRGDRVGMVSLAVVAAFGLLILSASLGVVAAHWQDEVALPDAPPSFMGPARAPAHTDIAQPSGPDVDLSAIDPLAPRYAQWDAGVAKYRTTEAAKRETLPFGADRLGRDVLAKGRR